MSIVLLHISICMLPPLSCWRVLADSLAATARSSSNGCLIEAPWLVSGGHGASLRQLLRSAACSGYGLSYTTFSLSWATATPRNVSFAIGSDAAWAQQYRPPP